MDLSGGVSVQVAGGFIGQQDVGFVHQGSANCYPLLFAARQLPGFVVCPRRQLEVIQQFGSPSKGCLSRLPLDQTGHGDIFEGSEFRKKMMKLKNKTQSGIPPGSQCCAAKGEYLRTGHGQRPFIGSVKGAEDMKQGAFPGAGFSHNGHHSPGFDLQRYPFEHFQIPIPAVKPMGAQGRRKIADGFHSGKNAKMFPCPVRAHLRTPRVNRSAGPKSLPLRPFRASMKILLLCKKFPYPMKDGESIAVSNLARELSAMGCEITLLSMNTSKHYSDLSALPPAYNYFRQIETVDLDTSIRPWKALASLMAGDSYHIRRFISSRFRARLIDLLRRETFDIVQLETLYMAPYTDTIRQYSAAPIVMRAHNVEHEIWERITRNMSSRLRKAYLAYLTHKLRQYEISRFGTYDYLVTLTGRDLQLFRQKGYAYSASAAPIGFDLSAYSYSEPRVGPAMSIGFIGSLDWKPNREGLDWFLQTCWPEIHQRWPGITFHIAGRNTPEDLRSGRWPGVFLHGEVDDAAAFIGRHAVLVVPLLSGSGMRVKVVEGMALGRIVITTALGLEGISGVHREHLFIADTPAQITDALGWCIDHPAEAVAIGRSAMALASRQFDSKAAAGEMLRIYRQLTMTSISSGSLTSAETQHP